MLHSTTYEGSGTRNTECIPMRIVYELLLGDMNSGVCWHKWRKNGEKIY